MYKGSRILISGAIASSALSVSTMNNKHPINNQHTDGNPKIQHNSRIFNGSVHGYIEHVAGKAPIIAHTNVVHIGGYNNSPQQRPSSIPGPGEHYQDAQLSQLLRSLQPLQPLQPVLYFVFQLRTAMKEFQVSCHLYSPFNWFNSYPV
jgi:hypothetical protein